jgi:hypothetical protein
MDAKDFSIGQIFQAPVYELCQDPTTQAKLETVFGDVCVKLLYGFIMEKDERNFKGIIMRTSGQKGPSRLSTIERENCILIKEQRRPFEIHNGMRSETCQLPNGKFMTIPVKFEYQPISGTYCCLAFIINIPYDSRVRLLD